jgi:SNF2 family DNA or RNA helicase
MLLAKFGRKLTQIAILVKQILDKKEKVIIYAQWNNIINIIKQLFKEIQIDAAFMVGNTVCQNAAIKKFKSNQVNVLVGIVDSTGLDLSEANHLIFSHAIVGDDYHVEAMEDQIAARIKRINQIKPTYLYHMITKGTIEEQIYLQTRKKKE